MDPSRDDPGGKWKRVIGILGGLGPHAHVEFERLLLARTEAGLDRPARDQDYPPWLLSSVPPTPDRPRAILGLYHDVNTDGSPSVEDVETYVLRFGGQCLFQEPPHTKSTPSRSTSTGTVPRD